MICYTVAQVFSRPLTPLVPNTARRHSRMILSHSSKWSRTFCGCPVSSVRVMSANARYWRNASACVWIPSGVRGFYMEYPILTPPPKRLGPQGVISVSPPIVRVGL
jgi:hypothetical protein